MTPNKYILFVTVNAIMFSALVGIVLHALGFSRATLFVVGAVLSIIVEVHLWRKIGR